MRINKVAAAWMRENAAKHWSTRETPELVLLLPIPRGFHTIYLGPSPNYKLPLVMQLGLYWYRNADILQVSKYVRSGPNHRGKIIKSNNCIHVVGCCQMKIVVVRGSHSEYFAKFKYP